MNQKTKDLAAAVMLAHNIGVKTGLVVAGMSGEAAAEGVHKAEVGLFKIAGLGERDFREVEAFLGGLAAAGAPLPPADEMFFQEQRRETEWPSDLDAQRAEYQAIAELFRQAKREEPQ